MKSVTVPPWQYHKTSNTIQQTSVMPFHYKTDIEFFAQQIHLVINKGSVLTQQFAQQSNKSSQPTTGRPLLGMRWEWPPKKATTGIHCV